MKESKILQALGALSQEARLQAFLLLLSKEEGMSAGDIAEEIHVPPTTMSFHLAQLRSAGLVETAKMGRFVIYRANRKKIKRVAQYITGKEKKNTESL